MFFLASSGHAEVDPALATSSDDDEVVVVAIAHSRPKQ